MSEKINLDNLTAEQVGQLFPIKIEPYNPDWTALFEQEKALITEVLGEDMAHGVEHIGSTSVAGLAAKPTVDILVEVPNLNDEIKQTMYVLTRFVHWKAQFRESVAQLGKEQKR
jgi:GrpB-like predicted nucleotidyltransferase (UPF0157 family)